MSIKAKRYIIKLTSGVIYEGCFVFSDEKGFRLRLSQLGIANYLKASDSNRNFILNSDIVLDSELQDRSKDIVIPATDVNLVSLDGYVVFSRNRFY